MHFVNLKKRFFYGFSKFAVFNLCIFFTLSFQSFTKIASLWSSAAPLVLAAASAQGRNHRGVVVAAAGSNENTYSK